MHNFTPWSSLAGGALIGLAAAILFFGNGRLAGISGIFGGLLRAPQGANTWRWFFVGGLLAGGAAMALLMPQAFPAALPRSLPVIALAGLLVGFGTRLGGGCTSGHGICGNARLAPRSLVATVTFIATGAATVLVVGGLS